MKYILFRFIACLYILVTQTASSQPNCSEPYSLQNIHDCLECNYLWELSLNKCISCCLNASEFYNQKTMTCQSCPEKCLSCNNSSSCNQCIGNLKYNYEYNKCDCAIENCLACDFKGFICKQCTKGYQQDLYLQCVKEEPYILISPTQGISLQTLFSFNLKNGQQRNNISYKCEIFGNNLSTSNLISISQGSCTFNTFLPTLSLINVLISEYSSDFNNNEVTLINQYNSKVSVSIVSSFTQLIQLWKVIQSSIYTSDNVNLQIYALNEYSLIVKNICQPNSFCQNSGNVCYPPTNLCICGPNSLGGMRDCSSHKTDEILLNSYLENAYSLCQQSIKILGQSISCPKPSFDTSLENEQKFITFLIDQSNKFNDDEDYIITLKNSITNLDNKIILQQIFTQIVERYVGKYNKIFSKADSKNDLLIIYNSNNTKSIDYSALQLGQIPVSFFEQKPTTIQTQKEPVRQQNYYQQILFSKFPQRVFNEYTQQLGLQFQYVKLIRKDQIDLTYTLANEEDFNKKQLICLQADQTLNYQSVDKESQQKLILCDSMIYDQSNNIMKCKCTGDTFLFLDDYKYLYLSQTEYYSILDDGLSVDSLQTKESFNNDRNLLLIIFFVLGGVTLIIFLVICISHRYSKISKEKILKQVLSPFHTVKLLKEKSQFEAKDLSMKKENHQEKIQNDIEIQSHISRQEPFQEYFDVAHKEKCNYFDQINANKDILFDFIYIQLIKNQDLKNQKDKSTKQLYYIKKEFQICESNQNQPKSTSSMVKEEEVQQITKSEQLLRRRAKIKQIQSQKKDTNILKYSCTDNQFPNQQDELKSQHQLQIQKQDSQGIRFNTEVFSQLNFSTGIESQSKNQFFNQYFKDLFYFNTKRIHKDKIGQYQQKEYEEKQQQQQISKYGINETYQSIDYIS